MQREMLKDPFGVSHVQEEHTCVRFPQTESRVAWLVNPVGRRGMSVRWGQACSFRRQAWMDEGDRCPVI